MSDGTLNTISHMTPEEKAAADAKAKEEADAKAKAEADADAAAEDDDTKDDDASDDDADKSSEKNEDELDLDKELEEEQKRGKPDPEKARKAFEEREAKRKAGEGEDDGDKPVSRKELAEMEQRSYKRLQNDQALQIAKSMAASDKEAQLIFAKWQNRSFPENLPLQDQIEEAFAITHRKKMIGERNEALRVARGKATASKDSASSHRDGGTAGEPKLSEADKQGLKSSGFEWDGAKRFYKKVLPGGKSHLYYDPKTKRRWRAA